MRVADAGDDEDDSYFGSSPTALDPAASVDSAERPPRTTRRRRREVEGGAPAPPAPPSSSSNRRSAAGIAVVCLPGAVASLLAIPRLRGFEAAGLGLTALALVFLPVSAWFTSPGATNTRRQRIVLGLLSLGLSIATALAARHVDGLVQVGLFIAAFFLATLAVAFQADPATQASKADPPTKRFRPLVVLGTVLLVLVVMVGVLFIAVFILTM